MVKRGADAGPEPPKRPQPGYGQFVAEKRAEITATLLKEGADKAKLMTLVAKKSGELWKALGEANQAPFNQKSEKLMVVYNKELQTFKDANPDFQKVKKLKKGDPAKPPSRPPGAYGQWLADNRTMMTEKVMKEKKVDKAGAFLLIYKEGKAIYEALSATEKKKVEDKAEAAKLKFQADNKEFKENHKDDAKGKDKGKEKKGGPKRPLGVYAQWNQDNRVMLTEKVMKDHKVDKSKAFLMLYKEGKAVYEALPAAEKKKCEENAEAAKLKFQAEMTEWKNKGSKADDSAGEANKEAESP